MPVQGEGGEMKTEAASGSKMEPMIRVKTEPGLAPSVETGMGEGTDPIPPPILDKKEEENAWVRGC